MLSRNSLAAKGNKNLRAVAALKKVAAESAHPTQVWAGLCLKMVRTMFGAAASSPTAYDAWKAIPSKYTHTWYNPPAGVPVYWKGGSQNAGHIAISDGHGNVWSSDIKRHGKVDLVPIGLIHSEWNLTYLGWGEMVNGVRVYD